MVNLIAEWFFFVLSQNQTFGVQMETSDRMVSAEFIVLLFSRDWIMSTLRRRNQLLAGLIMSYLLKHFTNEKLELKLINVSMYQT